MHSPIEAHRASLRPSRAEIRRRWVAMSENPVLADIPGKLELNEKGSIEIRDRSGVLATSRFEVSFALPESTMRQD